MISAVKPGMEGGLRQNGVVKKSTQGKPLISIVTVVFNGAKNIHATMLSVLTQTYTNVEYIIIDGGSHDGTINILREQGNKLDYWLSEPDHGIYDAMNKGITLASGEWINFMNCGDRLASNNTLELFNEQTFDAQILYGDAIVEYPDFQKIFKIYPLHVMWKHSPFCHQACFVKTSLMKQFKYDLTYRIGADHDFFFRAYKAQKQFLCLNKTICYFNGKDGTTKKHIIRAVQDKMDIAMKYEFTPGKWIYYKCFLIYIHLLLIIKKLVGSKITSRITRSLKGGKKKISSSTLV